VEPNERKINTGFTATEGGKDSLPLKEAATESRLQRILPAMLAKTTENAVILVADRSTQ